ncbi:MAG TPA: aminotransferase class IV [Jatrophihabitantaceae bacterium]|nr:aminotransferase class IV [Jatrophihabitantaceae bacterium]
MALRFVAVHGVGVIDPATPVIRADDAAFTRGDGCFEGLRVRTGADGTSSIDKLEKHLARMANSADALELAFDVGAWHEFVLDAIAQWHEPGEWGLKLVLGRGIGAGAAPTQLLMLADIPADYPRQRREGLRVVSLSRGTTAEAFADAPWLLGGVKTLSYAVNMAAQREAVRRGYDDAIFVSTEGTVLESTVSSVVWSTGRILHTTPTGTSGILPGTTQELLFERASDAGWTCEVTPAALDDLHAADVLWLIGSVRGPVDVVQLDDAKRERRPEVDAEIRTLAGFAS